VFVLGGTVALTGTNRYTGGTRNSGGTLEFATGALVTSGSITFAGSSALRFGLGIRRKGFNLFVLGSQGTGRHSMVRRFVQQRAEKEPVPEDWVYVAFVFEAGMRGESVTAYLNGMPAGQFDIPPLSSMDVYALELGLRVGCWSELFKGELDGVRILNVALTPEQLALRPDYPTPQN
jgi:hypothetical protein